MESNDFYSRLLGYFNHFWELVLGNPELTLGASCYYFIVLTRPLIGIDADEYLFPRKLIPKVFEGIKCPNVQSNLSCQSVV